MSEMDGQVQPGAMSLRRLWGELPTAVRGRPARWNLREVVEAGVRLADQGGLAAVTIASVAAELGAGPMSLYRHISSKDELLMLIEDAAVGSPPPIDLPPQSWREALRMWSDALASVYAQRPWLLYVPTQGPPAGPNQLAWLDVALHALRDHHLHGAERLALVTMLSGHIRNVSRVSEDTKRWKLVAGFPDSDGEAMWFGFVAERIHDGGYPALASALSDISARAEELSSFDDHEFMLNRILDAIGDDGGGNRA